MKTYSRLLFLFLVLILEAYMTNFTCKDLCRWSDLVEHNPTLTHDDGFGWMTLACVGTIFCKNVVLQEPSNSSNTFLPLCVYLFSSPLPVFLSAYLSGFIYFFCFFSISNYPCSGGFFSSQSDNPMKVDYSQMLLKLTKTPNTLITSLCTDPEMSTPHESD